MHAPYFVADIDRGGVFASVIGTFHLLEKEEREILRGFVITRFRGDLSLFRDGPALLEQHTQRPPCYGVLPYLQSLRIDQEDSLSLEGRTTSSGRFLYRSHPLAAHFELYGLQCA